jgi:hypothetical protein
MSVTFKELSLVFVALLSHFSYYITPLFPLPLEDHLQIIGECLFPFVPQQFKKKMGG